MNDRLYLAAHAPHQIPDNYHPKMPPAPVVPHYSTIEDLDVRDDVATALASSSDPVTEAGKRWMEQWSAACSALHEWHSEMARQRIYQWPLFWADNVMRAAAENP